MGTNDPEVINAKKQAHRVVVGGSVLSVCTLLFVVISARTYFGRPDPVIKSTTLDCARIHYVNGVPHVLLNTTNEIFIGKPPTFAMEETTQVTLSYVYMSPLEPKDPITFPAVTYSGSNLQSHNDYGGPVSYGTKHMVKYSAKISGDNALNLFAYDINNEEVELLAILYITFGCNVGPCRYYTARWPQRIQIDQQSPAHHCRYNH